jgi:amidohydrolase
VGNLNLDVLINLRKEIHRNPELSGEEKFTSEKIKNFISRFDPDETITGIAGNGIAFVFRGNKEGKTILFRSELDALPISEQNNFEYKSTVNNVAHKCGHDGHIAILSGLASLFKNKKPDKGKIIFLFQPAEETGAGAKAVLEDKKFNFKPDFVFALHNLPGYPVGSVIIKPGIFASASKGMIVKLHGKTSHASEPENGISPTPAAVSIMQQFPDVPGKIETKDFSLVTIIQVKIGDVAFGTSPGYGEIMATLRSFDNSDMDCITSECEKIIKNESEKYRLRYSLEFTEEFPASVNDKNCVNIIKNCAEKLNLNVIEIKQPFRWSEDFGYFLNEYKGALFGIGSGEKHRDLHNPDYDFPDEIIEPSVKLFYSLMNELI